LHYYYKTNIQQSNAGTYRVVVTNSAGTVTSQEATLTVNATAPTITKQPVAITKDAGTNGTLFTVSAAGTAGFTYQWQLNGVDIPGATLYYYYKSNIQQSNAGAYRVIVTNSVGSVISEVATLTVNETAPTITKQPVDITKDAGSSTTLFSVTASGTTPFTYQWQLNGVDIPGATLHYYYKTNLQPSHAGTYRVIVTNPLGSVTSEEATLTVLFP